TPVSCTPPSLLPYTTLFRSLKGLFEWKPAFVQWAFNIPLFIAGLILLGKNFGVKTAVGTVFLPFVVFLTESWEPWTRDPLLGALDRKRTRLNSSHVKLSYAV